MNVSEKKSLERIPTIKTIIAKGTVMALTCRDACCEPIKVQV